MAIRKQLVLPFAALLFCGVIAVNADEPEGYPEVFEDRPTEEGVSEQLAEGEEALKHLLGNEVQMLDKLLKPMIREMAQVYGVSEEELSNVAKEVMQKIGSMDVETLQATLGQLAGLGGLNLRDTEALQELLGKMENPGPSDDGI